MADNKWGMAVQAQTQTRTDAGVIDEGLRAYMLRVYNYMAAAVALTGVVAYLVFSMAVTGDASLAAQGARPLARGLYFTELGRALFGSPLVFVVMLAPLAFVFFLAFRVYKMSVAGAQIAFWLFAAVMGVSLSTIFIKYTGQSISRVFFITAAMFGALSLFGYTTKKDLSGWGTFLFMGLIGIIIAALVNIWLASPALQFAISVIGVLVFAGLTAYDTQRIKEGYYEVVSDAGMLAKSAIMGALNLYLDFINLFTSLLSLFGSRE